MNASTADTATMTLINTAAGAAVEAGTVEYWLVVSGAMLLMFSLGYVLGWVAGRSSGLEKGIEKGVKLTQHR